MRKKRVQKGISLLLAMLMFVSMIAVSQAHWPRVAIQHLRNMNYTPFRNRLPMKTV